MIRNCARHGPVEFHRYRRGPDAYRYKCKRCVGEAVTRRHRKVRMILVAAAGGCCAVCGYDRAIRALQFHHVDATQKSIEMTMAHGRSLAAYQEEARKCVLVCANCHVEIESGLIESPPAGSQYRSRGVRVKG